MISDNNLFLILNVYTNYIITFLLLISIKDCIASDNSYNCLLVIFPHYLYLVTLIWKKNSFMFANNICFSWVIKITKLNDTFIYDVLLTICISCSFLFPIWLNFGSYKLHSLYWNPPLINKLTWSLYYNQ